MLGHELHGTGADGVLVLNDWLADTSSWADTRPYLDRRRFTWAFTDVRGYGRSRSLPGPYDLPRVAADVLDLADALGWGEFALVGHSMTSLVALHLAQRHPERVRRCAVLTPPPPGGFGADDAALAGMRDLALGDDGHRSAALHAMWGDRLSGEWLEFKVRRWREAAAPEAAAAYVAMFARDGMPDATAPVGVPVLAVTGEEDGEPLREAAVRAGLGPLCPRLEVVPLPRCGHYPMQEAPPLLAATLGRFLRGG